jgi:hypothetical protein
MNELTAQHEVAERDFGAIRDELVALSQVRVSSQGDDLRSETQRASELLEALGRCSIDERRGTFKRLRDNVVAYEEGNGTSARNPVLDAIVGRVLGSGYFLGEDGIAIDMIQLGNYPLHLNDIIAFGIDDTAELISPDGPRADHFLMDVGAMTMVLEGRWVAPDREPLWLDVDSKQQLQVLRARIVNAEVAEPDRGAIARLIAAIDVTMAAHRIVPVVTNDRA